ncbi:hypothetical protein [Micavibrio aeruginosavorus]|uniref:Uncharacterized protein n=1 Tax=Micavibrio aeruginosavorus EPB TaxID=349215 RepID=M4VEK9_9BACT|nr:hypothetical protein [Micavibrio aeruginosavorus]AGH97822.1 hypothetical protein A11S_1002 [Micavibrio aeruginosavorus EPB]
MTETRYSKTREIYCNYKPQDDYDDNQIDPNGGDDGEDLPEHIKPYKGEKISPSDKFWSLRMIHNTWIKKLTPSEYMVLMFIWNRTIFWGKAREFIKYRHFTDGIPSTISGLPLKERRLKEILDNMQKKKCITRNRTPYGSWYAIDFNFEANKVRNKKPLTRSKRIHR